MSGGDRLGRGDAHAVSRDLLTTRRDLPHWQMGGSTYFITFRLCRPGESKRWPQTGGTGSQPVPETGWPASLAPEERAIVREEILHWHTVRWQVHMLTVMPDHVHLLATPLECAPGRWYSLTPLLHGVKLGSALRVNRLRGRRGRLWQSERYDRIVVSQAEFEEKSDYIMGNAVRAGITDDALAYDGFWCEAMAQVFETKLRGSGAG
jgi:putative transposase